MKLSLLIRRTHMYLALFLFPWMLMYGVSTLVMNHYEWIDSIYGPDPPPWEVIRETTFPGTFSADAPAEAMAGEILSFLDMDGSHSARRLNDGRLLINRADLVSPKRVTYTPADGRLVVEAMPYRSDTFLERFHRRRGWETGYTLDTTWAVTVDLVIAAMVFWALSGIWMWWEMKLTRRLGSSAVAVGAGLFLLYLITS